MSRIPPGFSRLAAELLDELIDNVAPSDAISTRHARLAELGRTDEASWHRITVALDSLIAGLRAREASVANGEIKRPVPPAPDPATDVPESTAAPLPPVAATAELPHPPTLPREAVTEPEAQAVAVPPPPPMVDKPIEAAAPRPSTPPPPQAMEDLEDVVEAALQPGPGAITAAEAERAFHERKTVMVTSLSEAAIQAALDEQMAPPPIPLRRELSPPPLIASPDPGFNPPPVLPARSDTRPPPTPHDAKARAASSTASERVTKPEPISAGWTRRAELLFEDALRLFRLGDVDGGLVSLERLLVSTDLNADLREFVDVNQDRILEQYETLMSPWQKVPELLEPGSVPGVGPITALPKLARVLGLVNGQVTVSEIAQLLPTYRRLEVISALSQLIRYKVVNLRETS